MSLLVPDLDMAQAFYGAVLGWTYVSADRPDARRVSDSVPRITLYGGHDRGKLHLAWQVDDVDAAVETVRDLGGAATDPVEMPYGSRSDCTDDQGMAFTLWQPPAGAAPAARPPDLAYLVLNVVDSARFRRFFGELLGWTFSPGRVEDGWNIEGTTPTAGFAGGAAAPSAVPMYRVDDVEAAVEPGAGRGRHGHRGRDHALRPHVRLHRRPGHALLPRPAVAPRPRPAGGGGAAAGWMGAVGSLQVWD